MRPRRRLPVIPSGPPGSWPHRHHAWMARRHHNPLQRRIFLWFGATIAVTGAVVGVMTHVLSSDATSVHDPGLRFVAFGAATVMLWAASGVLAWRLGGPLRDLERMARDLGEGRLSSRIRIHRHHVGEVRVVAEAMNEMAAHIQKQMNDQRELLAGVSHELRTPLGHMRVLVEIARDSEGVGARTLDELEREIAEMDSLIGELLASSRLDFEAMNVRELDANDLVVRAAERAGLDGALVFPSDADVVFSGDASLIGRAIANLIDNANKHAGGVVALRVSRKGQSVAFEVDDAGPGFARDAVGRAFEPFERNAAEGQSTQSTLGLGLSLVRRIARAHGGEASASNLPGGGARVGFEVAASSAAHIA